jgi:hypothetical protein
MNNPAKVKPNSTNLQSVLPYLIYPKLLTQNQEFFITNSQNKLATKILKK